MWRRLVGKIVPWRLKRLEWKPFMELSESQKSNFWEEGSRRNFQSLLMLTTVMVRWNQEFRWSKFNGNVRSKWNDQIKILVEGPEEKISSKFLKLENLIFENGVVSSHGLYGPGVTSRTFSLFFEVDQFGTNGEEKMFSQQMGGSLRTCMVVRSFIVVSKMNVTDFLLGLGPKYEFNCSFKKTLTETWLSVFGMGVGTWPNDRLCQNRCQGLSKPCFVSTREGKTCRVFSFDYLRLLTTNLSSVD